MKYGEQQMNKKEWEKHSRWLDQFIWTIIYDSGEKVKKKKKKSKKPKVKRIVSGYYFDGIRSKTLYEKRT